METKVSKVTALLVTGEKRSEGALFTVAVGVAALLIISKMKGSFPSNLFAQEWAYMGLANGAILGVRVSLTKDLEASNFKTYQDHAGSFLTNLVTSSINGATLLGVGWFVPEVGSCIALALIGLGATMGIMRSAQAMLAPAPQTQAVVDK